MALPRYTPGAKKQAKVKPPHGHSERTLSYKVRRASRQAAAATSGGTSAPAAVDPLDQPITAGSSITLRQARRMAKNATNTRYGGQETGINQQIASQQQLGVDQSGWYQQYLDALKGYQQDTQNRAAQTNADVLALSNGFRALDQGNLNTQQQQMGADAAQRGATVDPRLAQDASNASLVRQALQGSLGALIAQHGLTASNQASNMANVVGPTQRLQAQAQNMRQVGALQEQKTSLKGQEGSFAQQFIDSLRGDEAKNILAASIAAGRDLTTRQGQKETHRHNVQSEKNTRSGQRASANSPSNQKSKADLAYFKKHGYYPPTGPPSDKSKSDKAPTSGPGSLTTGQENTYVNQVNGAKGWVLKLKKLGKSQAQIRSLLASGYSDTKSGLTIPKYDTYAINAGMDLGFLHGLSPANVKALHKMGVHVNGRGWKVLGNAASQIDTTIKTGLDNIANPGS